jgi:DNA polymerase V
MIALLDCNNFYVSCERLFSPKLKNKPVVVLSNNDGCVISRSNEAKELGITMGEPFFKIKEITKKLQIEVLSSNYSLYADISDRIMNILKKKFSEVEIYSIDEAFFYLNSKSKNETICSELAKKILKWVGIPVSIGIAKTKTLAKISNRVIKKKSNYKNIEFKYSNVLEIKSDKDLDYILKNTKVADIWGVGSRLSNFLINNNINNALDLRDSNENFIKKEKGILVKKTIYELRKIKCYQIEKELSVKKSICVSRSFGNKIYDYENIEKALIVYVHKAVIKLIRNNLFCRSVKIFLKTSRYDEKVYSNSKTYKLLEATCDIMMIWKISQGILKFLYVKGLCL